jgi:stage VI sporulation protein D
MTDMLCELSFPREEMTLAEQQTGLRFDIYERVHLSEGTAGIKELEGVELAPHIQVLPQGEQALLRGNLLLSGTYVDEQDAVNRTLEHLIPVEITLPMNRVQRVEDISVEIENFDIDLLTARSLNITGVLSLHGLEAASPQSNGDAWSADEEEVVFVHETGAQRQSEEGGSILNNTNDRDNTRQQVQLSTEEQGQWDSPSLQSADAPSNVTLETNQQERDDNENSKESSLPHPSEGAVEAAHHQAEYSYSQRKPGETGDQHETVHQDGSGGSDGTEDKKDLKIAFSKKQPEEVKLSESIGYSSLLQSASSVKTVPRNPEGNTASTDTGPSGDRLEWKKLLLSSKSEQQEFRRMRLCIVQKEETLEIIAKRYELNPREIALFNRLAENEVMEGQIVYIPK